MIGAFTNSDFEMDNLVVFSNLFLTVLPEQIPK